MHEAYLRLVDVDAPQQWDSRGHFFAAAAEAMRRILINRARDKKRLKRGGGQQRLDWNRLEVADDASDEDLIAIDEALQGLTDRISSLWRVSETTLFCWTYSRPGGGVLGDWPTHGGSLLVVCKGLAL